MYDISLITGDGIGPELSESAISVLDTIHDNLGLQFSVKKLQAGDEALKQTGKALPEETLSMNQIHPGHRFGPAQGNVE